MSTPANQAVPNKAMPRQAPPRFVIVRHRPDRRVLVWRYLIVLTQTQTLDRNAVSLSELRFSIEGVYDGKLTAVGWDELHQRSAAPSQDYSFRYFQQVQGIVMLPPGFTPQRVRVSLRGDSASVDQTLAWSGTTYRQDT